VVLVITLSILVVPELVCVSSVTQGSVAGMCVSRCKALEYTVMLRVCSANRAALANYYWRLLLLAITATAGV
jgi:hypothetical protein